MIGSLAGLAEITGEAFRKNGGWCHHAARNRRQARQRAVNVLTLREDRVRLTAIGR